MDTINIEFKENNYIYKFNLNLKYNIYTIERYFYYSNEKYDLIEIKYYNNEIFFNSNSIDNNIKNYFIVDEKEQIIKTSLLKLINHIGFNSITAILINSFGYDVNYLMKKLKEKNKYKQNIEYNIIETKNDNESILNILNYNCEYIAKIYLTDNTVRIEKNTLDTINVLKIINKYLEKNNKPFIKILKNNSN